MFFMVVTLGRPFVRRIFGHKTFRKIFQPPSYGSMDVLGKRLGTFGDLSFGVTLEALERSIGMSTRTPKGGSYMPKSEIHSCKQSATA